MHVTKRYTYAHAYICIYTHVHACAFVREISIYLCPRVSPFRSDPIECVRHTRGPHSRRRRHRAIVTFTVCFRWIFSFFFFFHYHFLFDVHAYTLHKTHTLYIHISYTRDRTVCKTLGCAYIILLSVAGKREWVVRPVGCPFKRPNN